MPGGDHNLRGHKRDSLMDWNDLRRGGPDSFPEPDISGYGAKVGASTRGWFLTGYLEFPRADRRDIKTAGVLGEADFHQRLIGEALFAAHKPE